MPRKYPAWLSALFETLTPGQIQAGMYYHTPSRVTDESMQRGYRVIQDTRHLAGTRIPAPTIMKFVSGQWTPRSRSLTKLRALYERYNYATLRQSGFKAKEAARYRRSHPDVIKDVYKRHQAVKQAIYEEQLQEDIDTGVEVPVTMQDIEYGMSRADIEDIDDWEEYISTEE